MAFQKFKLRKDADWGRRKREKAVAQYRKRQRRNKAERCA